MANVKGNLKLQNGDIFFPASSADKITIADAQGADSNVNTEIAVIREQISTIAGLDTIQLKGSVDTSHPLPTSGYKTGWAYAVGEAGTYAGQECNIGDFIVCKSVTVPAANTDWFVLEANLINAISGLAASTDEDVMCFNGTTGKAAKGTGITKSQLAVASGVGESLDSNKAQLAKLTEDATSGLPQYDGATIGNGLPVVQHGAAAPDGLLPGALYVELDAVAGA